MADARLAVPGWVERRCEGGRMGSSEEYAEFRGFFMGEGCLQLSQHRSGCWVASVCIDLREDDHRALEWCCSLFGGHVSRKATPRGHHSKPQARWRAARRETVARIVDVLRAGHLPAKKQREVELMVRALRVLEWPEGPERSQALAELAEALRVAKRYFGDLDSINSQWTNL